MEAYISAMKNGGEQRWQQLCDQAAATTDPMERAVILKELADLLSEMMGFIIDREKDKES